MYYFLKKKPKTLVTFDLTDIKLNVGLYRHIIKEEKPKPIMSPGTYRVINRDVSIDRSHRVL